MSSLEILPLWQLTGFVFIFGVIIGSFLNVYIYRFHTGKSLAGSSHCLSCQTSLKWYELLPLVSYLFLRGRCRTCHSFIPFRYWLVEGLTGMLFVAVIFIEPLWYVWPGWWLLLSLLVVVAVYDLYHLVIPNRLIVYITLTAASIVATEWWGQPDWWLMADRFLAALIGFGFFASLWFVSHGRWVGFGDAKLALPLAFLAGTLGTISFIIYSFWIGAVVSVTLLLLTRRRGKHRLRFLPEPLTMKSEVPFAPFLIAGFFFEWYMAVDVFTLMHYALFF